MDTLTYVLLFVGAFAGGFVSGLAGFGTALMALGIWLYVLPPSLAVPLVLISSVVAQSATLPSMWRSFDLTLVWPFIIGGLLGVPLGTALVAHANPQIFKLTVGIFMLVFPVALYFSKPVSFVFGGKLADLNYLGAGEAREHFLDPRIGFGRTLALAFRKQVLLAQRRLSRLVGDDHRPSPAGPLSVRASA